MLVKSPVGGGDDASKGRLFFQDVKSQMLGNIDILDCWTGEMGTRQVKVVWELDDPRWICTGDVGVHG